MTAPLRPVLLNEQIGIEARRIAHEHTTTCNQRHDRIDGVPNVDDEHTKRCNDLKREIERLVMGVKLAVHQRQLRREPADLSS